MITSLPYRFIGRFLSPSGPQARLSILIYHRVLAEIDPIFTNEPTRDRFEQQMTMIKQTFNVLPLHDAVSRLQSGTLPARAACITFDDGYADNLTLATPILSKLGLHATDFLARHYRQG